MPHYYFHVLSDAGLDPDEVGVELRDLETARTEARRTVASFARDAALTGRPVPWHSFVIVDEVGTSLLTLSFSDLMGLASNDPR